MADDRVEKPLNRHIAATVWPIGPKFGIITQNCERSQLKFRILTICDVLPLKNTPFECPVVAYLRIKAPRNPDLWCVKGILRRSKMKSACYRNHCIDFEECLHILRKTKTTKYYSRVVQKMRASKMADSCHTETLTVTIFSQPFYQLRWTLAGW